MHFRVNDLVKPDMVKNISNGIIIKKRNDYRDNEIIKVSQGYSMSHAAPLYGDRFIPRRYERLMDDDNENGVSLKFDHARHEPITDILNWNLPNNYWMQNYLKDAIKKCFGIKTESRKLKLSDGNILCPQLFTMKSQNDKDNDKDWPCNPRGKPLAYSETTHDHVGFSNCFGQNMMDWSVNGQVVASFENDVIIWKRDISITFNVDNVNCLAYSPDGKYLVLGCKVYDQPAIELWDVKKYCIKVEVVQRVFFRASSMTIECFEWSKCGRFLLCGTSNGKLYELSMPSLRRLRMIETQQRLPIATMRFSTTMRFLAISDIAGNIVIYDWFSFNVYLKVRCKRQSANVILEWHPWNGVELAIAEQKPPAVVLLNVPNKQISAFYRRKDKSIQIHSLIFNKITAEILLSISRENSNGILDLKIVVLASLDRVVDVLTIGNGARFLMWDPQGTKVVTAGKDDSLTIWSFHPQNLIKENTRNNTNDKNQLCELFKKKTNCSFDYGRQFRLWSNIK